MSESGYSSDESGHYNHNFPDFKGIVFGNYHLVYKLGQGSYAQVWLSYNHIKNEFYALKIQDNSEYASAKEEMKILKRIEKMRFAIKVKDNFSYRFGKERFFVMVFPVYGCNLEDIKNILDEGLPGKIVLKFLLNALQGLEDLHTKYKIIHCDIKPDNYLLSLPSKKILKIMEEYSKETFQKYYLSFKEKHNNLSLERDIYNREKLHMSILNRIDFDEIENIEETKEEIIDRLNESNFLLSDFGSFCEIEEKYDEDFGTRYYRAPENILVSEELDYKSDIWSLGCSIYELLTNEILFDPDKCDLYSTDHHHLSMILSLGKFSNREIKSFQRKKDFFLKNKKLKKLPTEISIKDIINKMNSPWKDLLEKMLIPSYLRRPGAKELLEIIKYD